MPLIVFDNGIPHEDLDEFDECSLCHHPTNLLVWVRLHEVLCSMCGTCIEALGKAYAEMMWRRHRYVQSLPDESSDS